VRRGNRFLITSPAEDTADADITGSVKIVATATNNASLTREVIVAIRIAEEITTVANSIIVGTPAKRFKFLATRRGGEQTPSITGAVAAERIWCTSRTALVNVSLEGDYIYFATANSAFLEHGNALVAVLDADGNALWSWHIWITDYNPSKDFDTYGGHRVMNRNLGALINSAANPGDVENSYGLYYQWGRKDPFIGPKTWDSTVPHALFNRAGNSATHAYVVSSAETGNVAWATAHPTTFIAGASSENGFDWLFAARDNSLWTGDMTAPKSLYDPCPAGWRVAPSSIWSSFTATGTSSSEAAQFSVEGDYNYGWNFVTQKGADGAPDTRVFYPAAGRRSFSPTLATSARNYTNIVNDDQGNGSPVGFYWSASAPGANSGSGASFLAFRSDYINPDSSTNPSADKGGAEGPRAGGFPLRCVADN
jgi:hypothetical protein